MREKEKHPTLNGEFTTPQGKFNGGHSYLNF